MDVTLTKPNIDLHRHLDGNIRIKTILTLAEKHNLFLPSMSVDDLANYVHVQDKSSDLLSFLNKLDYGVSVLKEAEDCYQVAYENVQDAIDEGLDYTELRFSPQYMAKAHNLPLASVVEAVVEGVKSANKEHNYSCNLIGILSRTYGVDACYDELSALLLSASSLVAIDLAGDEKGFPAQLFSTHFAKVRETGLNVTIHAGEADGPESIWSAINVLGANRIGHGVSAHLDENLMTFMANNKIGIETCLLSNYQTGTWEDFSTHPLRTFLAKGIPVCLNTDDPGISNNTLASEYELAKNELKLSNKDIQLLKSNSLEMSFLSEAEKSKLTENLR